MNNDVIEKVIKISPIEVLDFDAKIYDSLITSEIYTIGKFIGLTDNELYFVASFNQNIFNELSNRRNEVKDILHSIASNSDNIYERDFLKFIKYNNINEHIINSYLESVIINTRLDDIFTSANIYTIDQLLREDQDSILKIPGMTKKRFVRLLGYIFAIFYHQNALHNKIYPINSDLHVVCTSKYPITLLNLSPRAENALHNNDIYGIEDLLALNPEDLKELRGLGVTSIEEITAKLETLDISQLDITLKETPKPYATLGEAWKDISKDDRSFDCLVTYFNNRDTTTYDALAEPYGVTRERIRQIIARGVKKIQQNLHNIDLEYLENATAAIGNGIEVNLLFGSADGVFTNAGVARLISEIYSDKYEIIRDYRLNGEWIVKNKDIFIQSIDKIYALLMDTPRPVEIDGLLTIFPVSKESILSIKNLVHTDNKHITLRSNKIASGTSREKNIEDYIREVCRPVTISELQGHLGISEAQVRSAINHYSETFQNVGKSLYGLKMYKYEDLSDAQILEGYLLGNDESVKAKDALAYMRLYRELSDSDFIQLIRDDQRFLITKEDEFYISLSSWGGSRINYYGPRTYEIQIEDAIMEVVRETDDLLDLDEIHRRLIAKYGDKITNNYNTIKQAVGVLCSKEEIMRMGGYNSGVFMRARKYSKK